MTWMEYREEGTVWQLVDGYLRFPIGRRRRVGSPACGSEIAAYISRRALDRQAARLPDFRATSIDAWFIGADGWLAGAPKLFQTLAVGETAVDYRILAVRARWARGPPPKVTGLGLPQAFYDAGVIAKTRHRSLSKTFRETGELLLGVISDYLEDAAGDGGRLFREFGVQCAQFSRRAQSNRDGLRGRRIQQYENLPRIS